MEDHALIEQVLLGNQEAYAELVRAHQAKILRLCASLLSSETEAEDAAQEIFLKAYQSLASFRRESVFSTWLYRIALNHCQDLLRKRSRQRMESLDALIEESGDAIEKLLMSSPAPRRVAESAALVEQILSHLSADQRLILTLREGQGLSYQEIAQLLSCSVEGGRARLRRAREALSEKRATLSGNRERLKE